MPGDSAELGLRDEGSLETMPGRRADGIGDTGGASSGPGGHSGGISLGGRGRVGL